MRKQWTPDELIAFEDHIGDLYLDNQLPFLFHLSGGNEEQLIEIFKDIKEGDYVISNHRSHYHALLHGLPPEDIESYIKNGRSMFIYDRARNFFCSAIIGGTPAIAAGIALAIKQQGKSNRVYCWVGDMSAETGAFHEAYKYCLNHDLPITFVVEDNKKSVCTPTPDIWKRDRPYYLEFEYKGGLLKQKNLIYYQYTNDKYPHAGAGMRVQF